MSNMTTAVIFLDFSFEDLEVMYPKIRLEEEGWKVPSSAHPLHAPLGVGSTSGPGAPRLPRFPFHRVVGLLRATRACLALRRAGNGWQKPQVPCRIHDEGRQREAHGSIPGRGRPRQAPWVARIWLCRVSTAPRSTCLHGPKLLLSWTQRGTE